MRAMDADFERMLVGVERADGAPVAVSEHGWKVVEIGGKKYLSAMSREEKEAILLESGIIPERGGPDCSIDSFSNCYPINGCNAGCRKIQKDFNFYLFYCN
jgi:hypothetical protein